MTIRNITVQSDGAMSQEEAEVLIRRIADTIRNHRLLERIETAWEQPIPYWSVGHPAEYSEAVAVTFDDGCGPRVVVDYTPNRVLNSYGDDTGETDLVFRAFFHPGVLSFLASVDTGERERAQRDQAEAERHRAEVRYAFNLPGGKPPEMPKAPHADESEPRPDVELSHPELEFLVAVRTLLDSTVNERLETAFSSIGDSVASRVRQAEERADEAVRRAAERTRHLKEQVDRLGDDANDLERELAAFKRGHS